MESIFHAFTWVEIPVNDFERAKMFYENIFNYKMPTNEDYSCKMGFFLKEKFGIGGAIVQGKGYVPSKNGPKVYLNGGKDVQKILNRIPLNGGKVIYPITKVSEKMGYFAIFEDCEGNEISLHSMQIN